MSQFFAVNHWIGEHRFKSQFSSVSQPLSYYTVTAFMKFPSFWPFRVFWRFDPCAMDRALHPVTELSDEEPGSQI